MSRARDLVVDRRVTGRPLVLSLSRVLAFSGGPFDEPDWPQRNLHTDLNSAREAGLDHVIASGTQSEGLLVGFLIDTFGQDWHDGGELDIRFLKPVRVGDTVLPVLQVTRVEVEGDRTRYFAACWCEIDDGSRVIEGHASCATTNGSTARPAA